MDLHYSSVFISLYMESVETEFSSFRSLIAVYIGALKLQGRTIQDWKFTACTLAGGFRRSELCKSILKCCFRVLLGRRLSRDLGAIVVSLSGRHYRRGQWTLVLHDTTVRNKNQR